MTKADPPKIHPVIRILVVTATTAWLPYYVYGYTLVGSLLTACACGFFVVVLLDYMDGNTYGWGLSDEAD